MDRPLRRGLDDPKADVPIRPLARNGEVDPKRSLVSLPLQYVAWLMIPARGRAGIAAPIGNHTFRATEIAAYIGEKLKMSRDNPKASRLFANELLHGAPAIGSFLSGPLKELVDEKARVIRNWITQGKIANVDPYHLIFSLWAMTQTYADFDVQIRSIIGDEDRRFADAERTILAIIRMGNIDLDVKGVPGLGEPNPFAGPPPGMMPPPPPRPGATGPAPKPMPPAKLPE